MPSTDKDPVPDPFGAVTTNASECEDGSGVCSNRRMLKSVASFVVKMAPDSGTASTVASVSQPATLIKTAAKVLNCDGSEACVMTHKNLHDFIVKTEGKDASKVLKAEALVRFKRQGPRNSNTLADNYGLDGVGERWAAKDFPQHFHCPFAMMDFDREDYQISRIDLADVREGREPQKVFDPMSPNTPRAVKRPCNTFACILNTDVSSGGGKHWVCVFVDMRAKPGKGAGSPWTIEYFNSSGRPPPKSVTNWMAKVKDQLESAYPGTTVEIHPVTDVAHQKGYTECGIYVMYYIRSRLDGVSWKKFSEWRVSDETMLEFRKHLFSGQK